MMLILDVREALRGECGVMVIRINEAGQIEVMLDDQIQSIHTKIVALLEKANIQQERVHFAYKGDTKTDPEITAMIEGLPEMGD